MARKQLVREQASHVLRVQKTLEDANIKLDSVLTDVMGKSGRAITEALIAGETNPAKLAGLADGGCRISSRWRKDNDACPQAAINGTSYIDVTGRMTPAKASLLRSAQQDRIEALARSVQTGIYSVNEARKQEGYDDVPYGDEPRTQSQNVPLLAAASIASIPSPPSAPAAAAVTTSSREEDCRAAVQKDIEAMTTRIKRPALKQSIASKPWISRSAP